MISSSLLFLPSFYFIVLLSFWYHHLTSNLQDFYFLYTKLFMLNYLAWFASATFSIEFAIRSNAFSIHYESKADVSSNGTAFLEDHSFPALVDTFRSFSLSRLLPNTKNGKLFGSFGAPLSKKFYRHVFR